MGPVDLGWPLLVCVRRTLKRSQFGQARKEAEKGAGARKRGTCWGALERGRPRGSDRLMVVKSHTNTTSAEDGPDARGMLPAMAALPLRGELVDKGGEKE